MYRGDLIDEQREVKGAFFVVECLHDASTSIDSDHLTCMINLRYGSEGAKRGWSRYISYEEEPFDFDNLRNVINSNFRHAFVSGSRSPSTSQVPLEVDLIPC